MVDNDKTVSAVSTGKTDKDKLVAISDDHALAREAEALSALMDGEASELELRRLLKSSSDSPELLQTWERYHLAQAVLHEQGIPVSDSLAAGVAAALDNETAHSNKVSPLHGWQQQLAKLAVAAAVAVVAVLTLQPQTTDSVTPPALVEQAVEPIQSTIVPVPQTLVADSDPVAVDPEAQQRLREYIESMSFDAAEPVRIEHIQDSPLYKLVNRLPASPD